MKTENNKNQLTDWQVEQLLKPCFAPSADDIRLPKVPTRRSTRRLWINIARIGGIAAALIVGMFFIISPNNTAIAKTPEQIVIDALEKIEDVNSYRVYFTAKVKPAPTDVNDYYRIAKDGEDINGTLTFLKTEKNNRIIRVEWENGITQLYDGKNYYEWDGTRRTDKQHCDSFHFLAISDIEKIRKVFKNAFKRNAASATIDPNNDVIAIAVNSDAFIDSPNLENTLIKATFSPSNGELSEAGLYEVKSHPWVPIVKIHRVKSNFSISKKEIMATPNKKHKKK